MTDVGSTFLTILEFILAFGALVFLHELGHFIAARANKIDVEEFGLGYPPKILRLFRAGGTDFTLNWIPFGGFCRMKGEAGDILEPGSFPAANPWRRLATLLGGPLTNLLVGMLIFTYLFTRTGAPELTKVEIIEIAPASPAAAELQVGDIITGLNGEEVDSLDKLSALLYPNRGSEVTLSILRDQQTFEVTLMAREDPPEGEGAMGVVISNPVRPITFFEALPMAAITTVDQGVQLFMLPVRLISGQVAPADARMVSVKGIYDIYAQVQTLDKQEAAVDPSLRGLNILSFLALISVALGFTNLLPIPALDGGHIIFLIPEILFRKRVRPELEGRIHGIAFMLLIGLMVLLLINDILNPVSIY